MKFDRPTMEKLAQDQYSSKEVGLIHPNRGSFIRLNDQGDIEISATEGLSMILHAETRSITFVADKIKFLTKEGDNIRWNDLFFNSFATDFTQPALVSYEPDDSSGIYGNWDVEDGEDEDI